MRLIYNSDAQRLQKNFDDKTPVTVSELFRSERTASVPIELFLVDNDGGYATPGSTDYEVLIGRQAQAVTTGKLTLTFTGTTEEIDLSKPKLATRIEAALNAVSEVNAAGGVDVVELKNGRAFQITFRSVGSRAAITAGVKDSMQPASVLISEVTAGTGSTREVQLLTLEEASLAEVSTSGWSANSNPALTITTLVEGTANTREVVQLSVSNDPAPGSFFVVSNSEPISTEATAAQVKTILNSALSNDIGSVKKTGERIWQITYKTNGDKTALSAGTHNLVKRPSVNATLSLNTTALAYAANSDGSDLSVGFTLKKSNEVLLSENVDLAEPFAEVIGSSAMLNNDSLGALFTIAGDDVNKGTAISLSGGLTYSSDTLAAPFLPLAGGTMTGDAVFNDGVKAIFGTSSDGLEIYHDGNSYIDDSGTGDLILRANDQLKIQGYSNSHNMAVFNKASSVDLYYNNSKKFETTDTGATISGKLIVNGDLDVSGTTTTFNSTVVTVDDPVFTVGGDTAPVASDNKDRGIEFRYMRSGESAKVGFFGYSNADDAFTFLTNATNNSEVFSGTLADLKASKTLLEDGSANEPSVSFSSDNDTGIYRASGNLAFSTGGTEAARFDSSGRLGIGYTSMIKELMVNGSILIANNNGFLQYDGQGNVATLLNLTTANTLDIGQSSHVDDIHFNIEGKADAMLLNSTGLGIGGTPNELLQIDGTSPKIRLRDTDASGTPYAHLDASDGNILLSADAGNEIASSNIQFAIDGTEAARFDSSGDLKLLNNLKISSAYPRIFLTDTNNNSDYSIINDDGTFSVYDDTNASHLMRLNSTGLGIGGTPSAKLDVKDSSHPININRTGGGTALIQLQTDGATRGYLGATSTSSFSVFNATPTSLFTVLNGGNVGIGATNPDSPLELEVSSEANTQTRLVHFDHNPTNNTGSGFIRLSSGTNHFASLHIEQVSSGGGSLYGTYYDTNFINNGTQTSGPWNNINFVTNEAIRMTIGGGSQAGNVGIATTSPSANADLTLGGGELCMAETTTPTADANFGKIYCKSDNKLYFQDGAGTEHEIAFV